MTVGRAIQDRVAKVRVASIISSPHLRRTSKTYASSTDRIGGPSGTSIIAVGVHRQTVAGPREHADHNPQHRPPRRCAPSDRTSAHRPSQALLHHAQAYWSLDGTP